MAFVACSRRRATGTAGAPDPLRVGVSLSSGRGKEALERSFNPLVEHLGTALGVSAQLVVASTARELNERFERGEVDLAYMSSVDFVRVEKSAGAVPLAMRTLDANFFSVVIARAGLEGIFPDDFQGKSFAFGGEESNSGHRMPRYFFKQMNLVPERFFGAVQHLPTHDAVLTAVVEGRVDLGVLNGPLLRRRVDTRAVDTNRFRQLWVSPSFVDAVWAVPARLSPRVREWLLNVFLTLNAADPAHAEIMKLLSARGFVPAAKADFDSTRAALAGSPSLVRP